MHNQLVVLACVLIKKKIVYLALFLYNIFWDYKNKTLVTFLSCIKNIQSIIHSIHYQFIHFQLHRLNNYQNGMQFMFNAF
jgi:hypothetical protein